MTKNRMEAFSDGVIAIIITIMVLEMKVPRGTDITVLKSLAPVFLSYVVSFTYVGIYWNNHHHLLQAIKKVNGAILWANLHLLFWLSLIPFVSGWLGENHVSSWPAALYGIVLVGAALAYFILTLTLVSHHGRDSALAKAIKSGLKEKMSLLIYVLAIPLAFVHPWIACGLYFVVAVMWLVPDMRIEKALDEHK